MSQSHRHPQTGPLLKRHLHRASSAAPQASPAPVESNGVIGGALAEPQAEPRRQWAPGKNVAGDQLVDQFMDEWADG
jgi:hypothetical protein